MDILKHATPPALYDLCDMIQVPFKVDRITGAFSGSGTKRVAWPGVALDVPLKVIGGKVLSKLSGVVLCQSVGDLGVLAAVNNGERMVFVLDLSQVDDLPAKLQGITHHEDLAPLFAPAMKAGYRREAGGYPRMG